MADILTFRPRPRPAEPVAPPPLSDATLRARIEAVAEAAVDTAERLIAILDRMDSDPDLEDGAEAEPSLAAPEHHDGSQVGWCRGGDRDRETEAGEIRLPEVPVSPVPRFRPAACAAGSLAWGGNGNVLAAAGVALLDLIERAG